MDPVNPSMALRTKMDAARLDAFVDGALSPEEAARVVLHLADCPGDQAYVDAVMETNALLAAAFCEPLHQALPERLRATIFPDQAAAAAARTAPRLAARPAMRRLPRIALGLIAASAALAFGLAAGLAPSHDPAGAIAGLPGAAEELRTALETASSGSTAEAADGSQIMVVASFRDGAGRPCREFEVFDADDAARTQGVACRDGAGAWSAEIAVASPIAPVADTGGAFVPAAGAGDDVLGSTLDRIGAGMILSTDEERALIDAGWAG